MNYPLILLLAANSESNHVYYLAALMILFSFLSMAVLYSAYMWFPIPKVELLLCCKSPHYRILNLTYFSKVVVAKLIGWHNKCQLLNSSLLLFRRANMWKCVLSNKDLCLPWKVRPKGPCTRARKNASKTSRGKIPVATRVKKNKNSELFSLCDSE